MSFFAVSFVLNLKKFALKKALWLTLALLPTALVLGGILAQADTPVIEITAGVHYDPASDLEARIFEALAESVSTTPFVSFVAYDDLDALLRDVRLGRLECGYVLSADIEKITSRDQAVATIISSPRTVATPILNELVAAAILSASAQDITQTWLVSQFPEHNDITDFVTGHFEAYRQMDIFMEPEFAGRAGLAEREAPSTAFVTQKRVFHGLTGLTILVLMMFCAPIFIDEQRLGLPAALRACGKLTPYYASLWAAAFVIALAIGAAGLVSMALVTPQLLAVAHAQAIALVTYAAVTAALMVVAVRALRSAALIQSFGLIIVILNIFFGGMLLDLAEISPELARLQRVFPLSWYIEAVLGS